METSVRNLTASRALWLGIAFSFGFTGLIWLTGALWLNPPPFAETQIAAIVPRMWYPWQSAEPIFGTRFVVWTLYFLHQIAIWYLIWRAQSEAPKYSNNLHWFNVAALGVNALFITLHLLQTHIWYDGLALDVPEVTSQASVVLMLVAILIMENPRRGLFFGYKAPISERFTRSVRKYHGYYFSWAILYTFWYHPMEYNAGHLLGFLYMFLLMLQGSLFLTRAHTNRRWTFVLETAVVVHGVMVAILAAHEWPRFFGGFLGILVITQMHGLGLSRTVRWIIGLSYIAAVAWSYEITKGLSYSYEAILIPFVEFLLVFLASGIAVAVMWLLDRRKAA